MPAPNTDERQRVRDYIVSQAAKLSIPELVAKVRADTAILRETAAAVPAARWRERPSEGDWSAAEVCAHILEMNERSGSAIEAILDGNEPPRGVADVMRADTGDAPGDAATFWDTFIARRERLYERVSRASGDENLGVHLTHEWFGALTWREWFLFMRVHDLDHMRQLKALVPES